MMGDKWAKITIISRVMRELRTTRVAWKGENTTFNSIKIQTLKEKSFYQLQSAYFPAFITEDIFGSQS